MTAITFSLLMVVGAFFFVVAPQSALATSVASPDVCQTHVGVSASASPNTTNVTISWSISVQSSVTLTWGNSTNYAFTQIDGTVFSSGSHTTFINFLEPSNSTFNSKYYFHILAIQSPPNPFVCPGTYSGSFTTVTETLSSSSQLYLVGRVVNNTGSPGAGGMLVVAHCSDWYGSWADTIWGSTFSAQWASFTHVASNGVFDLAATALYGTYQEVCDEAGVTTVVSILTYAATICDFDGACAYGSAWNGSGAWAPTYIVWDRPFIDAAVQSGFGSGYIPEFVDFSNAPAGYTSLSVSQSTTFENSYGYTWTISGTAGGDVNFGGGASSSTTSSASYTNQFTEGVNGGSLCWASEYQVPGEVGFSAVTRGWSYALTLQDARNGTFCSNVGVGTPSNWVPNGTSSQSYYLDGPPNSTWASGLHNVGLAGNQFLTWAFTISSTNTISTSYTMTFGLSGTLGGVLPLTFQTSASWSQSASTTSSTTLSWTLRGPGAGGGAACYNVVGEGGSGSSADMVAIFYWTGSLVNGAPIC